jgi:ATP-dependent protease ClpP protease subunit
MAATPYSKRRRLYKEIEAERKSRVLCYVTGDRTSLETQVAPDAVKLFTGLLDAVFPTTKISLILYTRGGNTMAAWSLINMLRMFCDDLEIIVPTVAQSAGTLMCLGADRIVMTKQAMLGPIDPSINGPLNPLIPGAAANARAPVSVEAVKGYIEMARSDFV